jgi:hypothetical protein
MANKHIGSSFASFLDEEGVREEVDLRAKKKSWPTGSPRRSLGRPDARKDEAKQRLSNAACDAHEVSLEPRSHARHRRQKRP